MNTNPKDSAFGFDGADHYAEGLTKREYFAATALSLFCSGMLRNERADPPHIARIAVEIADALIDQLNKE